MIRNKTQYFIRSKQRVRGNRKYEREQEYVDYPYWIEEVYRQKDTLKQINNNSIGLG